MNRSTKLLTLCLAAIAAISMVYFAGTGRTNAATGGSDPLYYPVLLIHGLGEGPGDLAFGNLQKYLKTFYYQSDVLDFNDFAGSKLAKLSKSKQGGLDVLAAILGKKIDEMKKDFKSTKVNIIAHSYGGMIVNAYLTDFGRAQDKRYGGYSDDVNKVIYIQTPFYGSTASGSDIQSLAAETDYGPFLNAGEIADTLELGSSWISAIDTELRKSEILTNGGVDVLTLTSANDELTSVPFSVLSGFTDKIDGPARYRVFEDYAHSANDQSLSTSDTPKGSLAYVNEMLDENFVTIASFLDSGNRWQRPGTDVIPETSYMMLNYAKETGFTSIKEDDVTFTYSGKLDESSVAVARNKHRKAAKDYEHYFNEKARTWVFYNIVPGKYKLTVKNAKNDGIKDQELIFAAKDQVGFNYFPKNNQLFEGNQRVNSNLGGGLFSLVDFIFFDEFNENKTAQLKDLDTDGFTVEFFTEDADQGDWNKGTVYAIYNQDGNDGKGWHLNGSRIQVMMRGEYSGSDPISPHNGKVTIVYTVDKNKDGYAEWDDASDSGDAEEAKSSATFDWREKHHWVVTVKTVGNSSEIRCWVDDEQIIYIERTAPYWNPNPWISIGGRRFDEKDYNAPIGCKLNMVVTNMN